MPKYLLDLSDDRMSELKSVASRTGSTIRHHLQQAVDQYLAGGLPCGLTLSSGVVISGMVFVFLPNGTRK